MIRVLSGQTVLRKPWMHYYADAMNSYSYIREARGVF
jgi:hypothetical protein